MVKDDYVRLMSIIPSVIDEKLEKIRVKIQSAVRKLLTKELLDLRREFGELLQSFQDVPIADTGPVTISVGGSSEVSEVRRSPVVSKAKHDPETAVACLSIVDEPSYRLRFEIPMIIIGLANWKQVQEDYEYPDVALKQASLSVPKEEQPELSKELISETNSKTPIQETTDKQTTLQKNHKQSNNIHSEIKMQDEAENGNTSMPKSTVELLERDTTAPVPRETIKKTAKRSYETDDQIPCYWNFRESPPQQRAGAPKTLYAKRQMEKIKEIRRSEELQKTLSSKRLKNTVDKIIPASHESPKKPTKRLHNDNDQSAGNTKQRKMQQDLEFPIDKKNNNSCKEVPLKVEESIDSEPNFTVRRTSLDFDLIKISSLGVDKKREKSSEEAILYRNIVNNTRKYEKQASKNTEASLQSLKVTTVNINNTKKITIDTKSELKHCKDAPVKIQEAMELDPKFSVQTSLDSDEGAVSNKNIVNNASKDEHPKPMDGDTSSQNLEATTVKLDEKINDSKNTNVKNSKHEKDQEIIAIDLELQKATPYPTKTKSPIILAELSTSDDNTQESLQNIEKALHKISVEKNTVEEQTVVDTAMQNLKVITVEIDEKINYSKNTNLKSSKHNQKDREKDTGDRELQKGTSDPVKIYRNENTEECFQNIGKTIHKSSVENNSIKDQTPVDTATQNLEVISLKKDENIDDSKNITIDTKREFKHSPKVPLKFKETMNLEHKFNLQPCLDSDKITISYGSIVINTSKDEQGIPMDAEASTQNVQPTMKLDEKMNDSKNTKVKTSKHNNKDREKVTIDRELQWAMSGQGKTKMSDVKKELNTKKNVVESSTLEIQATFKKAIQNLEASIKINEKAINEKKENKNRKSSTKSLSNEKSKETSGADIRHEKTHSSKGLVSEKAIKSARSTILPNKNDVKNTRNENYRDVVIVLEDAMQNLKAKTNDNKNAERDYRKESKHQKKTVEKETVHRSKALDTNKTEIIETGAELSATNLTMEESRQNAMKEMQENELPNDLKVVDAIMQHLKATSIKIDKDNENSKTVDLGRDLPRCQYTRWANASPPAKVQEAASLAAAPVKIQCKENNFSLNINNQETSLRPNLCEVSSTELELISINATAEKSIVNSADFDSKMHNTRNIDKDARKGLKNQLKKTEKDHPYPDLCEVSSTGLNFSIRATPEKYLMCDIQKDSRHQNKKSERENPEPQRTPSNPEISDKITDLTAMDLMTDAVKIPHEKALQKFTVEEQLELLMTVDTMQNSHATAIEIDKKTKNRNTNKDSKKKLKYNNQRTGNNTDLKCNETTPKTEKAIISFEGSELNNANMTMEESDQYGQKNLHEPGLDPTLRGFGVTDEIKNGNRKFEKKKCENTINAEILNEFKVPDKADKGGIKLKSAGKNMKLLEELTVSSTGLDFCVRATPEKYLVRDIQKDSRRQNKKSEREKPEPQHTSSDPEFSDRSTDLTIVDLMTDTVKIPHEKAIRKITIEEQLELLMTVDTKMQDSDATAIEIDKKTNNRNTNKGSKKKSRYDSKITGNSADIKFNETTLKTEKAIISFEGSELNNAKMAMEESDQNGVKNLHEPGGLVGSALQEFGLTDEIKNDDRKFEKKKGEKNINADIQNECKIPDKAVEGSVELKSAGQNLKLEEQERTVVATTSQKNNKRSTKNEKKNPETTTPKPVNPLRCFRKKLPGIEIETSAISQAKKFNAAPIKVDEPIKGDKIIHDNTKITLKNMKCESSQLKEINNYSNIEFMTPNKRIETPASAQSPHFVVRRKRCIIRNK